MNLPAGLLGALVGRLALGDEIHLWQYALFLVVGALASLVTIVIVAIAVAPALIDYESHHGRAVVWSVVSAKRQGLMVLSFALPHRGDVLIPVDVQRGVRSLVRLRFELTNEVVALRDFPVVVDLGRGKQITIKQAIEEGLLVENTGKHNRGMIDAELYYDEEVGP